MHIRENNVHLLWEYSRLIFHNFIQMKDLSKLSKAELLQAITQLISDKDETEIITSKPAKIAELSDFKVLLYTAKVDTYAGNLLWYIIVGAITRNMSEVLYNLGCMYTERPNLKIVKQMITAGLIEPEQKRLYGTGWRFQIGVIRENYKRIFGNPKSKEYAMITPKVPKLGYKHTNKRKANAQEIKFAELVIKSIGK